jgi:hypothetical protein
MLVEPEIVSHSNDCLAKLRLIVEFSGDNLSVTDFSGPSAYGGNANTYVQLTKGTEHLLKWQNELCGDIDEKNLLDGVENGFCITVSDSPPVSTYRRNDKSTSGVNSSKVKCTS